MARRKEKQPVHHVQMTEGKRAIIQQLLQEYVQQHILVSWWYKYNRSGKRSGRLSGDNWQLRRRL